MEFSTMKMLEEGGNEKKFCRMVSHRPASAMERRRWRPESRNSAAFLGDASYCSRVRPWAWKRDEVWDEGYGHGRGEWDEASLSFAPPRAARPDLTAGFRRGAPPCFFRTARAPSVPDTANRSAPGASGTEQNPNERHLRAAPPRPGRACMHARTSSSPSTSPV
ncbi:hypothetical protein OPV22_029374 [Ensete ventricosum]|uniref:Uncharacterized protein n=1 Tax=Ensete ventricosum TaxID=4639 RepID=A0AAV8Q108_ENSVE|nr:hypothetical protein OPV22_029374 [Ensete ventricosum]